MTYSAAPWASQHDVVDTPSPYSYGAGEPPATWTPFGAGSPFITPIAGSPAVDPTSANVVTWLNSLISGPTGHFVGVGGTNQDFDHPVYYYANGDPLSRVKVLTGGHDPGYSAAGHEGIGRVTDLHNRLIPLPTISTQAGGTDGHLSVVTNERIYDMWQARSGTPGDGSGRIGCVWGAINTIGQSGVAPATGATASHLALQGLAIRVCELQAGQINHALGMTAKYARAFTWKSPATAAATKDPSVTPGDSNDLARPVTGARFQLNMTQGAINALSLPSPITTILTALRVYGAFIIDAGGNGYDFVYESGTPDTAHGNPDRWIAYAQAQGWASNGSPGTAPYIVPLAQGTWFNNLEMLA